MMHVRKDIRGNFKKSREVLNFAVYICPISVIIFLLYCYLYIGRHIGCLLRFQLSRRGHLFRYDPDLLLVEKWLRQFVLYFQSSPNSLIQGQWRRMSFFAYFPYTVIVKIVHKNFVDLAIVYIKMFKYFFYYESSFMRYRHFKH